MTVFRIIAVLWVLTLIVETPRGIRGWRHEVARWKQRHAPRPVHTMKHSRLFEFVLPEPVSHVKPHIEPTIYDHEIDGI